MGFRTYLPGLLQILRITCRYIKRWETQIRNGLPSGNAQTALTAVLTACEAMEDILTAIIPKPD